jgi:hypothetical protein
LVLPVLLVLLVLLVLPVLPVCQSLLIMKVSSLSCCAGRDGQEQAMPATFVNSDSIAGMARSFYEPTTVKHYLGSADI